MASKLSSSAPPPTYVREQVVFFDAFLTAIRTNDQSFVGELTVGAPSAGILNYAATDYVAVVITVRFTENVDG